MVRTAEEKACVDYVQKTAINGILILLARATPIQGQVTVIDVSVKDIMKRSKGKERY